MRWCAAFWLRALRMMFAPHCLRCVVRKLPCGAEGLKPVMLRGFQLHLYSKVGVRKAVLIEA